MKALVMTLGLAAKRMPPEPPLTVKTLKGDAAKKLLRALKLAGVKPAKAKSKWTFKAAAMACHSAAETEDGLGSYDLHVHVQQRPAAAEVISR